MKSRNILITNDDGIQSPGLARLAAAAKKYGEVTVIAPDKQCSAMSHRILLRDPIEVHPVSFPIEGVKAYAATGTPADCVRFGHICLAPETDLILSGVNYGYNCGSDIQYSATIAAAMEASWSGIQAIAFSEGQSDLHEVSDANLEELLGILLEKPLPRDMIWNVNFPKCHLKDCKGILWERRMAANAFYRDDYDMERLPDGGYRLTGCGAYYEQAEVGTDVRAVIDGYISIGLVQNLSTGKDDSQH